MVQLDFNSGNCGLKLAGSKSASGFVTSSSEGGGNGDERVRLSVSLSICNHILSQEPLAHKRHEIFCACCSWAWLTFALVWRRFNVVCPSGFADNVMYVCPYNRSDKATQVVGLHLYKA